MYTHIHIYIYMHIYVYMHIYIHTYTYTHICYTHDITIAICYIMWHTPNLDWSIVGSTGSIAHVHVDDTTGPA